MALPALALILHLVKKKQNQPNQPTKQKNKPKPQTTNKLLNK